MREHRVRGGETNLGLPVHSCRFEGDSVIIQHDSLIVVLLPQDPNQVWGQVHHLRHMQDREKYVHAYAIDTLYYVRI